MYAYRPAKLGDGATLAWLLAGLTIAIGVFLSCYLTLRAGKILFTPSDVLFIAGAFLLVAAGRIPLKPFGHLTPYWFIALTAMLASLFISSLVNGSMIRWSIVAAQYLFAFVILPMLLMAQGSRRTYLLMTAFIAGIACMELLGVTLYFVYEGSHLELQRFGDRFVTGAGRLTGYLGNPNMNGAVIAMTLGFVYYFRVRRFLGAALFICILCILLVALALTASVTGIASAVAATAIFMFVGQVRIRLKDIALGAGIVVLMAASGFGMPRAFQNRIEPALHSGDIEQAGTYSGRTELVNEAWEITETTIFLGLGADQFKETSVQEEPVHNILLLLWTEGGMFALFGWVALMVVLFTGAVLAMQRDRLAAALALAVFSTFAMFSIANPHMYARFWLVPLFLAMAPAFALANQPVRRRHAGDKAAWAQDATNREQRGQFRRLDEGELP